MYIPEQIPGQEQIEQPFQQVQTLAAELETQNRQIGETAQGAPFEQLRNLADAAAVAAEGARTGNLDTSEARLEHAPRSARYIESFRDATVEVHKAKQGEPLPQQKIDAMNLLRDQLGDDEQLLNDRYNFFNTAPPAEGKPSPHHVANSAYEAMIRVTEDAIKKPDTDEQTKESMRIARDLLHEERKSAQAEFDIQTGVIEAIDVQLGIDDGSAEATVRGLSDKQLDRLSEFVALATSQQDPYQKSSMLRMARRGEAPIKSVEDFEAWNQQQQVIAQRIAERTVTREATQQAKQAEAARATIAAVHKEAHPVVTVPQAPRPTEVSVPPLALAAAPEIVVPPKVELEPKSRTAEEAYSHNQAAIRNAMRTVPQEVLRQTLKQVVEQQQAKDEQFDAAAAQAKFGEFMNGQLAPIDPMLTRKLAQHITTNGFSSSAGEVWRVKAGPSVQSRLAANARRLVQQVVAETIQ